MREHHSRRAAEIIKKIRYITIASVSSAGKPWNTPVYSAFDDDLSFYWASDKNAQHSQNVRANKDICLVIYDSTVPEGTGEGVYLQAVVQELSDKDEVLTALKVLDTRVGKNKERDFANYSGAAVLRVYKATVSRIWMNDDEEDGNGNYIRDIRVEIPLYELQANIKS